MAEYIEREAAIKLIAEDKVEITPLLCAITQTYTAEQAFDGLNQSCDRHIKFINSIPSADVQPVIHSRWDKHGYACPCLNCGYDFGYAGTPLEMKMKYEFKYCPNCGARMTWKGGKDG